MNFLSILTSLFVRPTPARSEPEPAATAVEAAPSLPEPPPEAPRTLDFGNLVVRQVCVPRTSIVAVQAGASLPDVVRVAAAEGVTKLPVYEESLDQVTGIVHLQDLLARWVQDEGMHGTAGEIAREALFVPDSLPVNDLLMRFRERRSHIAIVLDEFGGTAGLVTLEDVLKELVGDVQDAFDEAPPAVQRLPDGSVSVDGMTLIEELNAVLGLDLSDPNYDTLAGYVLGRMGHIPQPGESVDDPLGGIRLSVQRMDRLRIERVLITPLA